MKTKQGFLFAVLLAECFATSALNAGDAKPVADPQPILQDLHRKMSGLSSIYIEFTQERQLKLFSEPLKTEGVMLIERPDQIRWETTKPYQSILLANKKAAAQFELEDGKWKKLRSGFPQIREIMGQMSLMHQGNIEGLTSKYTVSAATNSDTIITLVPKDATIRQVLSSIEIQLLPDLSTTREVLMNEPSGDLTRIVFRKEVRDVKFPPGTFDLEKPVELAVIQQAVKEKQQQK